MTDDRPWLGDEPTGRPDSTFRPIPTGIAVFLAVASPVVFLGVARAGGTSVPIVLLGLLAGFAAGVLVGLWVSARGGRGPRQPL